jgi:hypothetical protein
MSLVLKVLSVAVILVMPAPLAAAFSTRSYSAIKLAALSKLKANQFIYTQLEDENVNDTERKQDNLQHLLTTIEKAAYSAGEITVRTAGKIAIQYTKSNIRDLVTESDVQCQELIKEIISEEFPNDIFLGEEDVDLSDNGSVEALKKALGDTGLDDDCLLFVVVSYKCLCSFWNILKLANISDNCQIYRIRLMER